MYSPDDCQMLTKPVQQNVDHNSADNREDAGASYRLVKIPLKSILIVLLVSQILLAAGVIAWLSAQGLHQATHDAAAPLLEEIGRLTAEHITHHLEPTQILNDIYADTAELGQIDLTANIRTLGKVLWKSIQLFEDVSFTVFANPRGEFIGARRLLDGSLQIGIIDAATGSNLQYYTTDVQGNLLDQIQDIEIPPGMTPPERPWYIAAVEAQASAWTDVYTTRSTESLAIAAALPMYDRQGELSGVFSTTLSLAQLNQFLQSLEIGPSGRVFIIDRDGRLIASSTGKRLYQTVESNGVTQKKLFLARDSQDALTRSTIEFLTNQSNWNQSLEAAQHYERWVNGEPEFIQITPLAEQPELGWRVIAVVLEADFMEYVHDTISLTIAFCLGALLLALGLSIVTARWIAQPIQQLNQTAKTIAQNRLQHDVDWPDLINYRTREVSELAGSFNRMIKQLQGSFDQLRALNTELAVNENRLKQYFEAIPVGVSVFDTSGQITYMNHSGIKLLNINSLPVTKNANPSEVFNLYQSDQKTLYPYEKLVAVRALKGESVHIDDIELHWPDKVIPLEIWGSPIFNEQGEIIYAITVFQDIGQRKQAEHQLVHNALHDALTDLPNRIQLIDRLELALRRAQRSSDYHFAVLFLDLDQFKLINDSLGHLIGDQLLVEVARKLQHIIRPTDLAARFGGDEFLILLENIDGIKTVVQVVERIFAEFEGALTIEQRQIFVTTSIGVVFSNSRYNETSDILRDADIALHKAKSQGRGCYEIFDAKMHAQTLQRMNLEHDLRQALTRQELLIYYQPIVALERMQLVGFEALLRWRHPLHGLISPEVFIPVAEETGLIVAMDAWVMKTACQQLAQWQRQFPAQSELKVSVNLTWLDLREPGLLEKVMESLAQSGLKPSCLTLEITESGLIEDVETTTRQLEPLKAQGVQFSIDDFGTGYSSLSYLHDLPVDYLKIDKSFVSQMHEKESRHKIVETILKLGQQLQLQTVAEGIESCQQLACLQKLGCELGQGYLFAQPLAAEAVPELLGRPKFVNLES